jgi:pyridinium-3,5-bisthiocarboxylic acid mononucleotide nickel chelatase
VRIRTLLESADIPAAIRGPALAVFARLADAEGRVHGIPADDVHFHEVGSWDAT